MKEPMRARARRNVPLLLATLETVADTAAWGAKHGGMTRRDCQDLLDLARSVLEEATGRPVNVNDTVTREHHESEEKGERKGSQD